jgi:cysteinyl-tRNA synthetase
MWTCCGGFCGSRVWQVKHVMNVTDVDDKIIRNALAAGKPIHEYTRV